MNDIQKHLVKLLKEIDEICMQNDIPYILGGRTAKDACQEHQFIGDYVYVTVLMRGQDFDKFCNLVAKKEDRAIESILENAAYPDGMSMRYVDETTSFIYGHTIHNCKHKGIYVNIYKCRNVPKNRYMAKISTALDLGVAAIALEDASILKGKRKTLVEIAHKISKVFGKPFMIKMLLGIQKLLGGSGNKNLALLRYNKKNTLIPRSMFTNVKRVEFGGAEFNVPVDHDNYLQNVYGKKWETDTKPEGIFSPHLLIAATDISYKEIEKDGVLYDNRKEINAAIKKRNSLNAQIKPLRKMITKNWDLLFLTRDRYILYRKYVPLTDTLKDYLAKHEYEELQNVMEEYMDILYLYLSKKLPLFVSDELDQIALELLKVTGDQKDVEKYMKFRADMPMKPINVKPDDADIV